MAHVNVPQGRRWPGKPRWGVLDVVSAALFTAVFVLLVLIVALLDSPTASPFAIDSCPAEEVDNMPCEDPRRNSQLSREMNFYRDRHCPLPGETPLCLVPPAQRVPDSGSVAGEPPQERKGHQGWMKEEGPYFIFPSGGTMFPDGAINYIKKLGQFIPLNKGLVRTALDMGCGVASFGGFLLKEDIVTFSFAPRDSHKSQIQFALERGIPAFVAMLGTRRLPFPASSFDLVHCSRCLIPFTVHNGTYLVEDKEWADLQAMVHALCYKLITVDGNTAIWKKPSGASCLPNLNNFRLDRCSDNDDPNEAWYFKLRKCITKVPLSEEISIGAIPEWPQRLPKTPARVSLMKNGIDTFEADTQLWARRVVYYKKSLGVELGNPHIHNVMDMNAFIGGFAAALSSDPVWVMNVVPARNPLTLDIIYDRGLIGLYHDWCEAFSTFPRTYDLIHVAGINSLIRDTSSGNNRCSLVDLMVKMDRMLRPQGTAVVRDTPEVIDRVARIAHAIRWTIQVHKSEPESGDSEKILVATKTFWMLPATSLPLTC